MIEHVPTWAIGGFLGLTLSSGVITLSDTINPSSVHLEVAKVEYFEREGLGYFRQQIVSGDGTVVPADWRVQITRRDAGGFDYEVCQGGGSATYHGETSVWDLDTWAGDDCPDTLRIDDLVEVSWQYVNEFGLHPVISAQGRITLVDGRRVFVPFVIPEREQ